MAGDTRHQVQERKEMPVHHEPGSNNASAPHFSRSLPPHKLRSGQRLRPTLPDRSEPARSLTHELAPEERDERSPACSAGYRHGDDLANLDANISHGLGDKRSNSFLLRADQGDGAANTASSSPKAATTTDGSELGLPPLSRFESGRNPLLQISPDSEHPDSTYDSNADIPSLDLNAGHTSTTTRLGGDPRFPCPFLSHGPSTKHDGAAARAERIAQLCIENGYDGEAEDEGEDVRVARRPRRSARVSSAQGEISMGCEETRPEWYYHADANVLRWRRGVQEMIHRAGVDELVRRLETLRQG